jgi:hypothetical protein
MSDSEVVAAAADGAPLAMPLFQLVRVLGVARVAAEPTTSSASPTVAMHEDPSGWVAVSTAPSLPPSAAATALAAAAAAVAAEPGIQHVAVGGCVGHAFLAAATGSDHLVVRYLGDSGFPRVRAIPWFRDPARRVVALAFSPSAEWLLAVGADGSLHLLPVLALVVQQEQQAAAAALDAMTADGADAGAQAAAAALPVRTTSTRLGTKQPGSSTASTLTTTANATTTTMVPSAPNGAPERVGAGSGAGGGGSVLGAPYEWLGRLPSLMTYARDAGPASGASGAGAAGAAGADALDGDGELGSAEDITPLWPPGRLALRHPTTGQPAASVVWWRTWSGVDCALVGTAAGTLTVVDLRTRTDVYTARLRHPITEVALVDDALQSFRFALVQTDGGGAHRLVLEQQTDDFTIPETLLAAPGRAPFLLVPVQRFARDRTLSVQRARQGSVLTAWHAPTLKLEVYGPDMGKYALFIYQVRRGWASRSCAMPIRARGVFFASRTALYLVDAWGGGGGVR